MDFLHKLSEKGTNKKLMRLIIENLVCFGPKRKGPNLLISRFIDSQQSLVQTIYRAASQSS